MMVFGSALRCCRSGTNRPDFADDVINLMSTGPAQNEAAIAQVPRHRWRGFILMSGSLMDLLTPAEVQTCLAATLLPVAIREQTKLAFDIASAYPVRHKPDISADALAELPMLLTAAAVVHLCPDLPQQMANAALEAGSAVNNVSFLQSFAIDTLRANWNLISSSLARLRTNLQFCMDRVSLAVIQDVATVLTASLKMGSGEESPAGGNRHPTGSSMTTSSPVVLPSLPP